MSEKVCRGEKFIELIRNLVTAVAEHGALLAHVRKLICLHHFFHASRYPVEILLSCPDLLILRVEFMQKDT